jgi:hypothetical protein
MTEIPKSQKKVVMKPNRGKVDNSPMSHWALGGFECHTNINNVHLPEKCQNRGKMIVRSLLPLSSPKLGKNQYSVMDFKNSFLFQRR